MDVPHAHMHHGAASLRVVFVEAAGVPHPIPRAQLTMVQGDGDGVTTAAAVHLLRMQRFSVM